MFRPDLGKVLASLDGSKGERPALDVVLTFKILNATLVAASKQRNTNAEKAALRVDHIPLAWKDKPAKLPYKDHHARWTLKFIKAKRLDDGTLPSTDIAIPFFGYKSHVFIDRKFRFIQKWKATLRD